MVRKRKETRFSPAGPDFNIFSEDFDMRQNCVAW